MLNETHSAIVCCGRPITQQEIKDIQEIASVFSKLSYTELTETICEYLNWRTAAGANKIEACMKMLKKMESFGIVRLPVKCSVKIKAKRKKKLLLTSRTEPRSEVSCTLKDVGKIELELIENREDTTLWNEYVHRYHYLGYKKPFGYSMRYFIKSKYGILGCILFSGAAKSMGTRDKWIGWTENQRLRNLAWVINNSRFVIFPWVNVKNLASHSLGKLCRRIKIDYQNKWNFTPALMETFVDPLLYNGICYQASNWKYLGMTTGAGLVRTGKSYKTTPKKIYVMPLCKNFRSCLCSENLYEEVTYE